MLAGPEESAEESAGSPYGEDEHAEQERDEERSTPALDVVGHTLTPSHIADLPSVSIGTLGRTTRPVCRMGEGGAR